LKPHSHDYRAAALVVTVVLCVTAHAQESASRRESAEEIKPGIVSGRVFDNTGQPLGNAIVYVRAIASNTQARNAVTDDEGRFQIEGLEATLYTISSSLPAYISAPGEPNEPEAIYCRPGDSVRLVMRKGGVITGAVTTSSGEPVVKARMRSYLIRDSDGAPRFGVLTEGTTDDRGIYRLYGLLPGTYIVSAGGAGDSLAFPINPYDSDIPIYAPSSPREGAEEVVVRAGEETSNVDIRYRSEPGRVVSGTVKTLNESEISPHFTVTLTMISDGTREGSVWEYQVPSNRRFLFTGVAEGTYRLSARSTFPEGAMQISEPRAINVKGVNLSGIELLTKPLGSISGHLILDSSNVPECSGKHRPLFTEMVVTAQREKEDRSLPFGFSPTQTIVAALDKNGAFTLRNVVPGRYQIGVQFRAKYWYVQSILQKSLSSPENTKAERSNQAFDGVRNWTTVKGGEQITGINITLAEGAASVAGTVDIPTAKKIPPKLQILIADLL
jgi:Carboxypeptidase regulatory-like domain